MKSYTIELNGGSVDSIDIFKDKKGRIVKLISTYYSAYFSGTAKNDPAKFFKKNEGGRLNEFLDTEDLSMDDCTFNDTEYEKCTKNDIKKIDEILDSDDYSNPHEALESIGFEFDDCEIFVYGPVKVICDEEPSQEEIKRKAQEIVKDMKIGEKLRTLKPGEKISMKIDLSSLIESSPQKKKVEKQKSNK